VVERQAQGRAGRAVSEPVGSDAVLGQLGTAGLRPGKLPACGCGSGPVGPMARPRHGHTCHPTGTAAVD